MVQVSKFRNGLAVLAATVLSLFAAPSQATTLSLSWVGSVFNCIDTSLNQPVNITFTSSGAASGANTIFHVSLGGSLGGFNVPIPTAQIDALAQAVSSSGGKIEIQLEPTPLGPPGCDIQGTLTLKFAGESGVGPDAPGNVATTQSTINSFVQTALPAISNRIRAVFQGDAGGLATAGNVYSVSGSAAGDGDRPPIGAWAGYSYTDSDNDFVSTAFSSDRHSVLFGLDVMPADDWLIGVSVSLERTDVKTRFNNGEQEITAISVTPYVGLLMSDWLTLDAAVGIGSVSTDQFRTSGAARIDSDVESTRVYGSMNATATWSFDRLLVSGRVGALYATQKDDKFLESNGVSIPESRSNVGRLLFGGELAYAVGDWEPYVSGTFEHDFTRTKVSFGPGVAQPKSDDTDLLIAVGLRYFGNDNVSGSLEYNTIVGRRNLDEDTISANLRWEF